MKKKMKNNKLFPLKSSFARAYPIIEPKTIADSLESVEPMLPSKEYLSYPVHNPGYPECTTIIELKEHILNKLNGLEDTRWITKLKASEVVLMPIIEKEQHILVLEIGSTWKDEDDHFMQGGTICYLEREKWNIYELNQLVIEIKKELLWKK